MQWYNDIAMVKILMSNKVFKEVDDYVWIVYVIIRWNSKEISLQTTSNQYTLQVIIHIQHPSFIQYFSFSFVLKKSVLLLVIMADLSTTT